MLEKLTDQLMRQLHVKEGIRPVMSLKERKRRRVAKSLARAAGAFNSIREKCDAAQVAVSEALAEAKVILLRASKVEPSTLPAAG